MSSTLIKESFYNDGEQVIRSRNKEKYVSPYDSTSDNEVIVYPESKKIKRKLFVMKINNWLNDYSSEDSIITNRDHCMNIYNDIKTVLHKKKYEITDEYQFKEDVIFYLYSLSDH